MKKVQIEKLIREEFKLWFAPLGFKTTKNKHVFSKANAHSSIEQMVFVKTRSEFPRIEFISALKHQGVESLVSEILAPFEGNKDTSGYSLHFQWHIFFQPEEERGKLHMHPHYEIQGEDYFEIVTHKYRNLYTEKIGPFLEAHDDLAVLESTYNKVREGNFPYLAFTSKWAVRALGVRHLLGMDWQDQEENFRSQLATHPENQKQMFEFFVEELKKKI